MKNTPHPIQSPSNEITLVIGGSGKTGRRIAARLQQRGRAVRLGSRSASPAFAWDDRSSWSAAIDGVTAIYIAYHPDLAVPGAAADIEVLIDAAREHGVRRLVLLSGRGEEEAQRCEQLVLRSGIPATVLRCSWFDQNFSESFLRDPVLGGAIALPVDGVREPFVDVDDIADVAVAALTEEGHDGEIYEITGPELLTFADVASLLAEATGREIVFERIPHADFVGGLRAAPLPESMVELISYLFDEVLDGRNARLGDGVQRALGREPRRFREFATAAAEAGVWER